MPVKVTPPSGSTAGSVDTNPIRPIGHNANIVFQFANGVSGWTFKGFAIKSTSVNQPPSTTFFQVINNLPSTTMTVQDQNGDGKLYSYLLTINDGTTDHIIDPDIQNDTEVTVP